MTPGGVMGRLKGTLVRGVRATRDAWRTVRAAPLLFVLGALAVGLIILYFALLGRIGPAEVGRQVSLSEFHELALAKSVTQATIHDEDARVVFRTRTGTHWTAYPKSDAQTAEIIDELVTSGARVVVDQQPGKARVRFVVQFLMPLVILAALFGVLFMLAAGKGGAAEFATFSRFKKREESGGGRSTITFADVAACKEAIIELQEVVDYLKEPGRFAAVGAKAPKGVLVVGPPGTGKTLLARGVAGEASVPFFSLSGSEFVESLVGVGAARVRDLFRQARESAPCIVFIDELDAAGRQRGAGMGQGNDEREQTLNQLLVEMDGFSVSSGIVIIGATNRPDILDPALLRPGRFDRQVVVDAPDAEGRTEILELHSAGRPLSSDVDLARLAKQCPGFTGADLANLINEAALLAVRARRPEIVMRDLEEAVDRVIAGPERRSHVLTAEERRLVAVHEAGHAITAVGVGLRTGVQKLSIIARGRTLGHTTTYQLSDRLVVGRTDLVRQIVTLMGGAAAEQMVLDETSTGIEGDLRQATQLARAMIATFGMGDALGRAAFGQKSGEVFLGRDFTALQQVSPATLEAVDDEIRVMLERAETDASRILVRNRDLVDAVVESLLRDETLSGAALDEILAHVSPGAGSILTDQTPAPSDNGSHKVKPRTARRKRGVPASDEPHAELGQTIVLEEPTDEALDPDQPALD